MYKESFSILIEIVSASIFNSKRFSTEVNPERIISQSWLEPMLTNAEEKFA